MIKGDTRLDYSSSGLLEDVGFSTLGVGVEIVRALGS